MSSKKLINGLVHYCFVWRAKRIMQGKIHCWRCCWLWVIETMSFDLVAVLWGLKFGQVVKGLCIRAVKLGRIGAMNGLLVTPCLLIARLRSSRAGADALAWPEEDCIFWYGRTWRGFGCLLNNARLAFLRDACIWGACGSCWLALCDPVFNKLKVWA